jgi:hypothetical protein
MDWQVVIHADLAIVSLKLLISLHQRAPQTRCLLA